MQSIKINYYIILIQISYIFRRKLIIIYLIKGNKYNNINSHCSTFSVLKRISFLDYFSSNQIVRKITKIINFLVLFLNYNFKKNRYLLIKEKKIYEHIIILISFQLTINENLTIQQLMNI